MSLIPSYIQTILSASELNRIMLWSNLQEQALARHSSWAIPPIGNCTLPRRLYLVGAIITLLVHQPFAGDHAHAGFLFVEAEGAIKIGAIIGEEVDVLTTQFFEAEFHHL